MNNILKDLIEGGFIGQAIIGTLVWGLITFLIVQKTAVDNRLYDAGFIVLGYLFHMSQVAVQMHASQRSKAREQDCQDVNGG